MVSIAKRLGWGGGLHTSLADSQFLGVRAKNSPVLQREIAASLSEIHNAENT